MAIKPDITEKELVRKCLSKDRQAQKELYTRYSGVLFAICMRYSLNAENAKDMLQDSFIKAFEVLPRFRFEGSFEGWLKRIAVTTCLDFNKKLKTEPFQEDVQAISDIKHDEMVHANLNTVDLINLLQKLPVGYRTVFNLYAIEGYSHQEISELLSISENTSKTQLFKARKMLQAMLVNPKSAHGND